MAKGCGTIIAGGLATLIGLYALQHGGMQSQGFVTETSRNLLETVSYFGKDIGRGDGYLTARYLFDLKQFSGNGASLMWLYLATTVAGVACTLKGLCNLISKESKD
ncbi:hypothetical protein HZB88_00105 [archaeon]|nr:hypothetical protein [archaeon]